MAYPVKMREKALEALRKGYTKTEVNKMLGLSNSVLKSWEELERETGSLEKRPSNRKPLKVDLDKLQKYCEENPLATNTCRNRCLLWLFRKSNPLCKKIIRNHTKKNSTI